MIGVLPSELTKFSTRICKVYIQWLSKVRTFFLQSFAARNRSKRKSLMCGLPERLCAAIFEVTRRALPGRRISRCRQLLNLTE
jgi:hypothetical protein